MKQYITNPDLTTILSGYKGVSLVNGKFVNDEEVSAKRPKIKDILRWQLSPNPERKKNKKSDFLPKIFDSEAYFIDNQDKIIWLGHASFLLTINGRNILIDPVFKNVSIIQRRTKFPVDIDKLINIDYLLISHAHLDHLDKYSVKKIAQQNPYMKIFCGLNTSNLIRRWGVENQIVEAGWWQQFPTNDDIEIYFLPAQHWSNRNLNDRNTKLWGSFIIRGNNKTVYFMGDSSYANHFIKIGNLFPNINYAIMGVGAYTPRNIMQSSHLDPSEARMAYKDLNAHRMIPMHYGTFILSDEPISEPLAWTQELFVNDRENLLDIGIGELLKI